VRPLSIRTLVIVAAVAAFAVLATPALAQVGKPYEQLDVNRALPNVAERTVDRVQDAGSAPYEQLNINRALPELRGERSQTASAGSIRSDLEIATEASESAFSDDHNFVAPAL
jgi:hypothetical protein